jgi:hypothetical protein
MKKTTTAFSIAIALLLTFGALSQAWSIEKIEADKKAVELINNFMKALQIEDATKREAAALKFLHKSMLTNDGKMPSSLKNYSFKKACDGVKFYDVPVKITEVHKGRSVTVGFKETAERGRTDKYFVGKKEGAAGRPAPLHVFWPEGGGKPMLINVGSL